MKKVLAIFAVVAMIGATSCKKDYTCSCDWSVLGVDYSQDYTYEDVKKADAEEACDSQNAAISAYGSCELK